jgi:beta-xylosidase
VTRPSVRPLVVALVAACVVLTACASTASSSSGTTVQVDPGARIPTKGPVDLGSAAEARSQPLSTVTGLLFDAPIYPGDFADPFSLRGPDANYAYATNTTSANVPVLRSTDGLTTQYLGDAMPDLPSWTSKGFVWAPSVLALGDTSYVLYYSSVDSASGKQCVSRATSSSPAGPFTDDSSAAFICQIDQGGSIDPSPFLASDGTAYLVWKNDGNCCKLPTKIWIAPLAADGLSLTGDPTALIEADQDWEGGNVEAPALVESGGTYYLFYSANNWDTSDYAIGYATCTALTGPCTKPEDEPWMPSVGHARGPGGQEFFTGEGTGPSTVWMVYHGWLPGQVGEPDGTRRLYLDEVRIEDGRPVRIGTEEIERALLEKALPFLLGGVVVVGLVGWFLVHRSRRRQVA